MLRLMTAACIVSPVLAFGKHDYIFFYRYFFPRAGYQFLLRKEHKLVKPVRHGLHSESHTTIWDHPACVPSHWSWGSHGCLYDSIKLLNPGTLVSWTVTLLFHKGMAHISICTYADKPVSSWNAVFGETQSQSTMLSAVSRSNNENFSFYFLAEDRPSFTWSELASVFYSCTFFCSRWYSRWPALSYILERWWSFYYSSVRQLECSLRDVKNL